MYTYLTRTVATGLLFTMFGIAAAHVDARAGSSVPESTRVVERPKVLPEAEERALALEALPPSMRADAGVWVLTSAGSRERKRTRNGYTCIVNRDEVLAIKPTCFDEEGTASILPVNAYFSDRMMQGVAVSTILREIDDRFARGVFRSPRRAGIAFMLSPRIVNVLDPVKRTLGTAPPHYMIYAPNVTNEHLRIPPEAYRIHPWLPYVAYTGPQGYLIISIPDSAVAATRHVHGR
ncbi:MAG: hypothetical protein IT353_11160 [Gemmatimonadaceae bacterium]|nr:hypothetical protein [Gemmatimonadaceae bacterium]